MRVKRKTIPLYYPLNVLKPVADNIWIADGNIVYMSMGIVKIPFSTRMTVIRLPDGGLWCHSPIEPNNDLLAQINSLGEVKHLVSPNYIHYVHIAEWKRIYPRATCWASPNVRERAAAQNVTVIFDRDLSDEAPPEWSGVINQHIFKGSRIMQEVVFFHHDSKTLVLTDLIENFEIDKMGFFQRWLTKLAGNADPDGKAPIDMRLTFSDRKAARNSLDYILAWQPEKIILAHGRCYFENADKELKRAFRWLKHFDA